MTTNFWHYDEVNKVADRLYVGTLFYARGLPKKNPANIDMVLNCTQESFDGDGIMKYERGNLAIFQIPIDDGEVIEAADFLNAMNILEWYYKRGSTILINCHAGVSRSVTMTCVFLCRLRGWKFEDAYDFVRKSRKVANPHRLLRISARLWLGEITRDEYEAQLQAWAAEQKAWQEKWQREQDERMGSLYDSIKNYDWKSGWRLPDDGEYYD